MSTGSTAAFNQAASVALSASTASASAALPAGGDTLLVSNTSTAPAWVAMGGGTTPPTAAIGAGYLILPGARRVIASSALVTQVAAVLSTGTGIVYIETGTGNVT